MAIVEHGLAVRNDDPLDGEFEQWLEQRSQPEGCGERAMLMRRSDARPARGCGDVARGS